MYTSLETREEDIKIHGYYATPPEATRLLLSRERFEGHCIHEPCSGGGHIARVLEEAGYRVRCSDVRDGDDVYGERGVNLFTLRGPFENTVTNPKVSEAAAVAEHLLAITTGKVALLMPWHLLPTLARRPDYEPPRRVYLFVQFLPFLVGGDPCRINRTTKYWAWYVYEKGYSGPTEVTPVHLGTGWS